MDIDSLKIKNMRQLIFLVLFIFSVNTLLGQNLKLLLPYNSKSVVCINTNKLNSPASLARRFGFKDTDILNSIKGGMYIFNSENISGVIASINKPVDVRKYFPNSQITQYKEGEYSVWQIDNDIIIAQNSGTIVLLEGVSKKLNATLKSVIGKKNGVRIIPEQYINRLGSDGDITTALGGNTPMFISTSIVKGRIVSMCDLLNPIEAIGKGSGIFDKYSSMSAQLYGNTYLDGNKISKSVDMYRYLRYFKGDIMVTGSLNFLFPELLLCGEVNGSGVLTVIGDILKKNGLTPQKVSEEHYRTIIGFIPLMYGIKDGVLYVTNSLTRHQAVMSGQGISPNYAANPFSKIIKQMYGGVMIKVNEIVRWQGLSKYFEGSDTIDLLSNIDTIEATGVTQSKFIVKITLVDKNISSWETLLKNI